MTEQSTLSIEARERLYQDFHKAGFKSDEDVDVLIKGFEWYTKRNMRTVPLDVFNERVAICRSCEEFCPAWGSSGQPVSVCKKCGCTASKMLNPEQQCPLKPPKWTAIEFLE